MQAGLGISGRRVRRVILLASLVSLLGCGGSVGADSGDLQAEVEWAIGYMKSDYLWANELPAQINADDYRSGEEVLEGLRVQQDRFSNITNAASFDAFFGGQTVGFGFNFRYESNNIRIFGVQPNAPATAAGLLRGDLVTAIDNKLVSDWISEDAMNEALGKSEPGVMRTFTITRGESSITLSITKASYALSYVLADALFDQGGRKIGYVNFYSFADPGVVPWRNALDNLIAQGAQDLIVDLRFNGGGLISTAAQIGSALGTQSLDSQAMTRLTFNDQRSNGNSTYSFRDDSRAGRFENLVWLTSRSTCSAAEALILGIKSYRSATRIGDTTCGKPVGFTPAKFNQKVFSVVTFRLENPDGETDYFDGLAADCPVTDTGQGVLGQANEVLAAAALEFLRTGICPTPGAFDRATKSRAEPAAPVRYNFDSLTNLR